VMFPLPESLKPDAEFARAVTYWPQVEKEGWKSVTFDLSDLTPDAARAVLDGITFGPAKP
jgi:hypothetical protein